MGAAGPLGEQIRALFDSLAPAFLVINGAGLALGIFILMYSIVAGVTQTANEGQFLGKRFSSIWMPIRMVTGAALLVPIFGGMAAAQKIVLWFAVVGVGLANLAADALTIPNPQFFVSGPVAQQLAQKEFIRQSCIAGMNIGYQGYAEIGDVMPPRDDMCGAVTWPSAGVDVDMSDGTIARKLLDARQKAFKGMSDKLQKIAEADYRRQSLDASQLKAQIEMAAQEYSLAMKAAGGEFAQHNDQASQQKPNFIEFGFNGSFSAMKQQQIAAAIASLPQVGDTVDANQSAYADISPVKCEGCPLPTWWDMRHSLSYRLGIDLITTGGVPPLVSPGPTNISAGSAASPHAEADGDSFTQKIFGKLGDGIKEWAANWALGGASNPILYAQNLGQNLLNAIGIAGVVAIGLAMVPAIGTPVMPMFLSISIPLSAMAIALASYLPLIPSIMWLMSTVSWIVLMLECLLGSALWALIHFDPEGEGMGNRTQRGYLVLADLFFRPSFLVIAFAAANIILIFVAGLSNGFFVKSLSGYEVGGLGSLIGFLGELGVCAMVQLGLVSRVYAQCMAIPDQIMMWLGGMGTSPSVSHTDAHSVSGQQVGDAARGLSNVRPTPQTKPDAGTDTKIS